MKEYILNTLPQELVNQIAAGEVIERPASVVKELIDNSIDAKATKIQIRIENGGIDLIEISDNGVGIPQESLNDIFKSHTTSKISSLEDLNSLLTMGFRGEALSTILSVSQVELISKYVGSETASKITFRSFNDFDITKAARESGTVVSVKGLFEKIPARRKFLKTPQTEYKKILDILFPYFLIYPNIHFSVIKDSKQVIELPKVLNSNPNTVEIERVKKVLKDEYIDRMIKVFYDGNGIKISGFTAHPSDHQKRYSNQYIFVNSRPIWDSGIAKAVLTGYERYIPFGEKVPYILLIDINPDQIDINVHPRKEEIRFLNPFRIYSSISEAIQRAVSTVTTYRVDSEFKTPSLNPINDYNSHQSIGKTYSSRDITFKANQSSSVKDSLLFSQEVLNDTGYIKSTDSVIFEEGYKKIRNIFQIFNKYIVIEFEDQTLWLIDQHAAAERITFEKLLNSKEVKLEQQNFLVPISLQYSLNEMTKFENLKEFFSDLGFKYSINKSEINIESVPVEFVNVDLKALFDEVFALGDESRDISKELNKLKDDILATISCHTSIRSGQSLHREEMIDIYSKLIKCENPYSCPHGRPIVWKLTLSEIDSKFDRTY
ncbi:DNA mismatch repair endonuclease MutL [Candidatus Dojkabacteria bacterium]|uniref:DNA mismatch repair protein MutL n=1 Tax=Candidatus Dojkabacteria bacterium TaxID=2099670 RepID=A0A847ESX1_9BACT|nr:DNA mismatch repair endonuclease MutL [Candidatus Dojkabacteria bacterium]